MQAKPARVSFHDFKPDSGSFLGDVVRGLSRPRKALPAKYFYDERGCALFEAICELPEYYLTRAETTMMLRLAPEMAAHLGPGCALIEFGSGNSRKTRILLNALRPPVYMPIDIAGGQLKASSEELARVFPDLEVLAVCADYTRSLRPPPWRSAQVRRKVIYFPGSTIGNFTQQETLAFLRGAASMVGRGGAMLAGVDLKKDAVLLSAAYNDAQGVTAEFNLNLLRRINRELGADFDLARFRHHAFYNPAEGRIEMHLLSLGAQRVTVAGQEFEFREGETIHTENSCKYAVAEFRQLAEQAGFAMVQTWTDPDQLFSVHYLEA